MFILFFPIEHLDTGCYSAEEEEGALNPSRVISYFTPDRRKQMLMVVKLTQVSKVKARIVPMRVLLVMRISKAETCLVVVKALEIRKIPQPLSPFKIL